MTIPSKDKHLTNYNMAASIRSLIARDEVLSFGDPVMGTCCFHTKILISIKIPYLILYRYDDVCYQIITTYVLRIIAEQVRTESLARDLPRIICNWVGLSKQQWSKGDENIPNDKITQFTFLI